MLPSRTDSAASTAGKPGALRPDTLKLLRGGILIFGTGLLSAGLAQFVFGGIGRQGPHTNAGWLCLMIAMGCLPTGFLSLLLAVSKVVGDRGRRL